MKLKRTPATRKILSRWRAAAVVVVLVCQMPLAQNLKAADSEAEHLDAQVQELYEQNRIDEALPLSQRALAAAEAQVPPDEHLLFSCLNHLAELTQAKQDYPAARTLYERALVISRRKDGEESANTAVSLNNLASLYYVQAD